MCPCSAPTAPRCWPTYSAIQRNASQRYTIGEFCTARAHPAQEDLPMADILAVGITHYPPLSGRDESMSWILKRMLENPHLPEKLRHSENWPDAMRKEWSTDEGFAAARAHREQLRQSLRRTRAQIDEFRPDFIVIWG